MTGLPTRKALKLQVEQLRSRNGALVGEIEHQRLWHDHNTLLIIALRRELEKMRLRELRHVNQIHKYQLTNQERRLRRLKAKQRELEETARTPVPVAKAGPDHWSHKLNDGGYWVGYEPKVKYVSYNDTTGVHDEVTFPEGATAEDARTALRLLQEKHNPEQPPGTLTVNLPADC